MTTASVYFLCSAVSPSAGSLALTDDVTTGSERSRRHALASVSSPALSTLDRVFRLEGYVDRPKNRRPVMGTSTGTKTTDGQ